MASLSEIDLKPFSTISRKTSPGPLHSVLKEIFENAGEGVWLVGGTALAGYYAEHRRSDDLDLFALDEIAFQAALSAIQSMKEKGVTLVRERRTPLYFHADASFQNHAFTIDLVLDQNLHRVGKAWKTEEGVWVASLPTLFRTKAACLVSRCSEKDLFDLDWIFGKMGGIDPEALVAAGSEIDSGLTPETLIISLQGTVLREEACRFLLSPSAEAVKKTYKRLLELKKEILSSLLEFEKKQRPSKIVQALSQSVRDQRKKRPFTP